MRTRTGLRVLLAVAIGVLSTAVVGVGTASAHVTVNPKEATQGGYAKLAFRVPNEKDNASTTRLEIVIPTDRAPIASVSTRPVPGWTVAVEKTRLPTPLKVHDSEVVEVVSKITWTAAEGSAVAPATFQEFEVSAGPLPEVDRIAFKALQTYSDGDVVRWIDEGAEADRPAPVLTLAKAAAAGSPPVTAADTTAPAAGDDDSDGGSGLGLTFGIAGLVAGVAALVVALLAYRRRPAA